MIHLTARAYAPLHPLASFAAASWMWTALRRAFPRVSAALLMPNHPHLLTDDVAAEEAARRLSQVLRAFTRRFAPPGMRIWRTVADPVEIVGTQKRLRNTRYVLLNPCRARLAPDPLAWRWSTLRDVVGASVDPWVTCSTLAAECGRREDGFAAWLHRYVSADPSVQVDGTAPPTPAAASQYPPSTCSKTSQLQQLPPPEQRARRWPTTELRAGCSWRLRATRAGAMPTW